MKKKAVKFDDVSSIGTRALQVYLVLIGTAWNKGTVNYRPLSVEQMGGYGIGRNLNHPLGAIWGWCKDRSLPSLNELVISQETDEPGGGAPEVKDLMAERQKIYAFNWFSIMPPTAEELEETYRDWKAKGFRSEAT